MGRGVGLLVGAGATALVASALLAPLAVAEPTPGAGTASVEPAVVHALETKGRADFWVDFDAKADLSAASGIDGWAERGAYVVDRLKATASAAQATVATTLKARDVTFRTYWAANRILVRGGTQAALDAIVARPEVATVSAKRTYDLPQPPKDAKPSATEDVEWNIAAIRANEVWDELGVRGEGIVVGTIDTGAQFDHPALVGSYRGTLGGGGFDHAYNWFDPEAVCTPSAPKPCDDGGHGTHILGTIVGDGGPGNHIGVAPGASWVVAKACRFYACDDAALLAAGQWMLAPTDLNGQRADPAKRPHVLNNSWGADAGADTWYRDTVRAWLAAGQFPAFAAGNNGADKCASVGSPASYPESYAVGSVDPDGVFALGSGLGPSPIEGSIKPNIAAPGVAIRSSWIGGGYQYASGTSTAVAHVSGAVALMLSASSTMVGDVPAVRAALDGTAADPPGPALEGCGGVDGADNSYGSGRLDAFAAVRRVAGDELGTLTGRITDAATGQPIAGARIDVRGPETDEATTAADGRYHAFVAPGGYDLTVRAFGYEAKTMSATATGGATTTRDASLTKAPRVTVSGVVTDGSGQGWPLHARIEIGGYPNGPVVTDPVTGRYAVELVPGEDYMFTVTSQSGGYEATTRQISTPAGDSTQDFALDADATCLAPGYQPTAGLSEAFELGKLPPGWTMTNHNADPFRPGSGDWRFDDPARRGNLTGGSGGFAVNDSDFDGPWPVKDAELVSPAVDLTAIDQPVLRFNHDLSAFSDESFDVDLSVDGGSTWSNVLHQTGEAGLGDRRGPRVEEIAIPEAARKSAVKARFRYYDAEWDWWWQVDNVVIGGAPCAPRTGGLVVGRVTDTATGAPLAGAEVTTPDDANEKATAGADGRYTLFTTRTGSRTFTASQQGFRPDTRQTTVAGGEVTAVDLTPGSGHLVVAPAKLAPKLTLGGSTSAELTLTNDGTEDVRFELAERDRDFTSAPAGTASQSQVRRVRIQGSKGWAGTDRTPATEETRPAAGDPPWRDIAGFPGRVYDSAAATYDGKVYAVGGIHTGSGDSSEFSDDLHIYDPATDTWRQAAGMSVGREAPSAAFLDGKLYVVGGWEDTGKLSTRLEIYDPATNTWTRGADAPAGRSAAGFAAAGGALYLVGGCPTSNCPGSSSVFRYDPAADAWQTLGAYPQTMAFPSCGAIDGTVYCAGGALASNAPTPATYAYESTSDSWRAVAPMNVPLWGGAAAVANGQLVVAGGVTGAQDLGDGIATTVTNEVVSYDPIADRWSSLPPSHGVTYRGAGACGFYKVGGLVQEYPSPRTRASERLPGYDQCASVDASWMSLGTTSGVLTPGQSVTVAVELAVPTTEQPGTYAAAIGVAEDTPHLVRPVAVTVEAAAPASWGKVEGTVTGLAHCDTAGRPLEGATVQVGRLRVPTDENGRFAAWMNAADGPVTVATGFDGYVRKATSGVAVDAGRTSTVNLALRRDEGCASIGQESLEISVAEGAKTTTELTLRNTGGGSYEVEAAETLFALDPVRGRPVPDAGPSRGTLGTKPTDPVSPIPSWFDGARLPSGVHAYGGAQCDGDPNRAYVVSGVNSGGTSVDSLWRYDAASNRWSELAPLPQDLWPGTPHRFGLTNPVAVCEARQIHVIGGTHDFVYTDVHFVYDLATDTWTTAAPAPRPVAHAAVAAWNGKIYLAGGESDQIHAVSDAVDVYDLRTDSWTRLPTPMRERRTRAAYAQSGPYLYVVGGSNDSDVPIIPNADRLDLRTGEWTEGPPVDVGRIYAGLAATDQAIYLLGGFQLNRGAIDHVDRLATGSWPAGAWTSFDPLPENKSQSQGYCAEAITGAEIVTAGGFDTVLGGSDRTLVHGISPERCPTIRADVPWLAAAPVRATVPADGSAALQVAVDATDLEPGVRQATLLLTTTDPGAPELRVPVRVTVTKAAPPSLYVSTDAGTVGGIAVADEDVVGVNPTGLVTPYFDGSDVGLAGLTVDAFARLADGALALSFTSPAAVPGIAGQVDDSDLVRFVPSTTGAETAGTFTLWFDGSDVGLTTDAEDVDAVEVLSDGRIALSTTGELRVAGVTAANADLTAFGPTTLGATTAGTFADLFDGSDVGLAASSEDVDAAAVRADSVIALSTTGALAAPGLAASDDDAVAFTPTRLGRDTKGTFGPTPLLDGAALGLEPHDLTGVDFP